MKEKGPWSMTTDHKLLTLTCCGWLLCEAAMTYGRPTRHLGSAQEDRMYKEMSKWPTADEIDTMRASAQDIQYYVSQCVEWVETVLQRKWIPTDLKDRFFGLTNYVAGCDTLLVNYDIDNYRFAIKETAAQLIVTISGIHIASSLEQSQVKDVLRQFFTCGDRIAAVNRDKGTRSDVDAFQWTSAGWAGRSGHELNDPWWATGRLWAEGSRVVVAIQKTGAGKELSGYPELRHRFPPLPLVYKQESTDALARIALTSLKQGVFHAEGGVALEILLTRTDVHVAIGPFIAGYVEKESWCDKHQLLQVIGQIARSLGRKEKKGYREAVSFLMGELSNKAPSIRRIAVAELGALGSPDVTERLKSRYLMEPDETVRECIERAIKKAKTPPNR